MSKEFDYSKLRGKIRELYHTESDFAKEIGLSKASLSAKLNGRVEFNQGEIICASHSLGIAAESIHEYFFTEKVKAA